MFRRGNAERSPRSICRMVSLNTAKNEGPSFLRVKSRRLWIFVRRALVVEVLLQVIARLLVGGQFRCQMFHLFDMLFGTEGTAEHEFVSRWFSALATGGTHSLRALDIQSSSVSIEARGGWAVRGMAYRIGCLGKRGSSAKDPDGLQFQPGQQATTS